MALVRTLTPSRPSIPIPGRLSIVVPTRNEQENVEPLARRIAEALGGRWHWQLVFVDDSTDETPDRIRALALRLPVRLVHRAPGGRVGGLGGAVLAGFAAAEGDVIVVMDADLQHPPELVARLAAAVTLGMADIVIASRFAPGASTAGPAGRWRHVVTGATRRAAHLAVPRCRQVRDPLSGFFALRSEVVASGPRRSEGFKVLLDVLALGHWSTAVELPFVLEPRATGASKAQVREGWRFARQLVRLRLGTLRSSSSAAAGTWRCSRRAEVGRPVEGALAP